MIWDREVDVLCIGTGAAGLAIAIAVVDFGGEVFVAARPSNTSNSVDESVTTEADLPDLWPLSNHSDTATNEYLAALAGDLDPIRGGVQELPIRVVHALPVAPPRVIAPFVGERLRDWGAECLASPYGWVYTRVTGWQSTSLHTADGENIEVVEIGSMSPGLDNVAESVLDWLTAQAHDREIQVEAGYALQRIVFEEGHPVGGIVITSDGELAVRARHGVTVTTDGQQINAPVPPQFRAGDAELKVCLVGRQASRFGRVELLVVDPERARPCRPASPTAVNCVPTCVRLRARRRRGAAAETDTRPPAGSDAIAARLRRCATRSIAGGPMAL